MPLPYLPLGRRPEGGLYPTYIGPHFGRGETARVPGHCFGNRIGVAEDLAPGDLIRVGDEELTVVEVYPRSYPNRPQNDPGWWEVWTAEQSSPLTFDEREEVTFA